MSSTPSIRISHDQRYARPPAYASYSATATPMAIPCAQEPVPPPLPPPPYIPETSEDLGWQWGNPSSDVNFGRSVTVKPGSSLLGGSLKTARQIKEHEIAIHHRFDPPRRSSSMSTAGGPHDQDMLESPIQSIHSPRQLSSAQLKGERQLEQRTLERSSQSYDKQLLSRIGGPNTPKRQSLPYTPENVQVGPMDAGRRNSFSLLPLSVPERRHTSVDSPTSARWPTSGAISPGFTGFAPDHGPTETSRGTLSRNGSLTYEDTGSHRGSYDSSMFFNDEFYMEEGQISTLNIHDRSPGSPKAGSKRRASSPPREREDRSSVSSASGQSEICQKRPVQQLPNRASPVSRFHPNHSSLSSASSFGPRHGSMGSSLGMPSIPSSATSYGSERISPTLLSPTADSDFRVGPSSVGSKPLHPSAVAVHQRTLSESDPSNTRELSTDIASLSQDGTVPQMQGTYICECCPKKPRKFDTEDELKLHENEKQYTCAYCSNRFKNKNEAERHQNSLHLRRHSWSCAALSGVEAAFHPSSTANNADICGYCGQEFSNPPQWDLRAEHLNTVHKFGECNQAKKFFRADHFRQHLKHSHQGTSGKWTNVLENACMKDEPPPEKRVSPIPVAVSTVKDPPCLTVTTTGLPGPGPGPPNGTIEETPHDT